jgi:hypothetical protein
MKGPAARPQVLAGAGERRGPALKGAVRFSEENRPALDGYDELLLESAHKACESLVPRLREIAASVCSADGENPELPLPSRRRGSG